MNILICTSQVPFVSGGAELHVANLKRALIEAGHEAVPWSAAGPVEPRTTISAIMLAVMATYC